ncbi:lipopolysaccharide biosynthesis protein [Zobellia uliginosa]|uniref:lipopolysaccharide biosynthesis protein n=1 Tax=Zobellia uliginosa TaxID=143224 RepID=UPI001C07C0F7|nr:oligosaccharide flippase family protein [Zobellia uliginosa]MBU2947838.1 oligosaccharide flippase family protein [Zobellia uliginosa]
MKSFISKILSKVGVQSDRTKNITKHVLWSAIYKGGSIIATFLLVPLTINFLDTENYGVWLTLSSFIGWFAFFDIGLGNGLRNKFAEAKAKGDLDLAKGYVSTAYYTIGAICAVFFILSLLVSYFVDWASVFNTSQELQQQLRILMPVVFGCFSLQLIFKLITSIYIGNQNHSMQGKIQFIIAASSLFLIWVLTQTTTSSLLLFGVIFSVFPIVVLLSLNIYAFSTTYKEFKPQFSFWKKAYFKDIFSLGIVFFIIQIAGLIMFTTDNFIITQLLGPEEVVPYNIAYKYIGISQMISVIILTPYWSSITDAYTKGELGWIKNAMKNLLKISLVTVMLVIFLVFVAPSAYKLWIGELVEVPMKLTVSMALYFIISLCYSPFVFFINGIGKIKLQMYSVAIGALLNVPLSIFLVKYTSFGVEGVIIATSICVFPNLILLPIQYFKIINNRAIGIWDK